MYIAVPPAILKIELRFHMWSRITAAHPTSSGIPNGDAVSVTDFKQYTTSIPIIAYGRTLPSHSINFGVLRLPEKIINGKKRVSAVTAAITPMDIREYVVLFKYSTPSYFFDNSETDAYYNHCRN